MEFIDRLITALTELHPLHPMLVHFPIGLIGAASLFILLALWKNEAFFEQAAFANISLATVATLAAGLSGLYDNQVNYLGDAPNDGLKITLATVLLILTITITVARWRNRDLFNKSKSLYVGAYFISFGLALTLAFLGGVILYGF